MRLLLEPGESDMNKAMEDGATPCYIACHQGVVDVVRLVLEAECYAEKVLDGETPPLVAAATK